MVPFEQRCRADEQCQPNLEVMVTPGAMLLLGGHAANMTTVLMLCNCGEDMHEATGIIWHFLGMAFHRARPTSVQALVPMSPQHHLKASSAGEGTDGSKKVVDPTLAEMGKNLNEAMKMLEDSQRKVEEENEKKYARKDIPGPLQGSGQDMVSILQLVQNLMHGEEEEESSQAYRLQNVGEQGHMALLGHSLAAYISVLDKERLRKLTTRILSDTTLWLCRLFRYENGSAYYHEDDREGLLKICRLVIHTCYEDYTVEGFNVLCTKQPVIYISSAARTGLGQALCNQLGLPLSCMCRVPCNTMFGSQHQMDVALLDRLIKDDVECGKLPLLLVANAGTPGAGHTDKLGRLKELCEQYNMWLHVEGVNLATLALGYVSSSVLAATKCDSMTLTLGSWLGLPAVPAVTLYKHEDPSLSQRLLENLKNLDFIKTSVEDELSSPVVVFKFFQKYLNRGQTPHAAQTSAIQHPVISNEGHIYDTFNQWLGEQLAQMVPASGIDVVELEDEGTCVRFSPLMTSAGPEFGGQKNCVYIGMVTEDLDVSELVETIAATGREIEENSRLLENMTEVVRKGIQEAQLQLQKANEERLLEEGLLRQIPVVGSVLNWFSPFQASPKGRTFNLTAGQKIFKRSLRNSDAFSETSSVSHCDDLEKMDQRSPTLSPGQEQRPLEPDKTEQLPKAVPQATSKDTEDIQSSESPNDYTNVEEQGSQR
ncbi:hypothetical protein CIB84_001373 [Bambusicola thoracicus]|uniref:Pyridoxal-dependent decarboxylase domain-containing protein 1 n=1 Tax=Bambusicola thoracicus TaxID=9083 RepID=A0A2P4TES9_BAMTH|nr:hypothetical protein CIB84_001373 [Bambusicola thoracicus]